MTEDREYAEGDKICPDCLKAVQKARATGDVIATRWINPEGNWEPRCRMCRRSVRDAILDKLKCCGALRVSPDGVAEAFTPADVDAIIALFKKARAIQAQAFVRGTIAGVRAVLEPIQASCWPYGPAKRGDEWEAVLVDEAGEPIEIPAIPDGCKAEAERDLADLVGFPARLWCSADGTWRVSRAA